MSDTTDDLTPEHGLASAYLDGEVTPDERARVEGSPELLDEVEALRQVRAVLGATTEPPPISVRESQLAAALDVWDRMSDMERGGEVTPSAGMDAAAAAAITTPPPTSLAARRERRGAGDTSRWLLGAAAGLVVLAGAGVAIRAISSGSDDQDASSSAAGEAPAEEAPASEAEVVPEIAAGEFAGEEVESAPVQVNADDVESEDGRVEFDDADTDDAAADVAMAEEAAPAADAAEDEEAAPAQEAAPDEEATADEAAPEEEPADEPAEEPAEALDDAPAAEDASSPNDPARPEADLPVLETPAELADFAAFAAYADVDAEAPGIDLDPPFDTCGESFPPLSDLDTFTEPALYQGAVVAVGIDLDTDPFTAIAFFDADCTVVEQVALPTQADFDARAPQQP